MEEYKLIGTVKSSNGYFYSKEQFFKLINNDKNNVDGYGYYVIGNDITNIKVDLNKQIDDHLFDGIVWLGERELVGDNDECN